ncbi:MAG: SemiSWEET transporter [Cyclobacteriaceae bacterium]
METVGFIAAFCTTISFLPQVIRTIKTRNTYGISLGMYSLFVSGVVMWLIYGLQIEDMPMIVANSITLVLGAIILFMKIRDVISQKNDQ